MKIAVVILNWNGEKLLKQFIPTIIKYSSKAQIYVADNASDDNSVQYLKDNHPEVNIVINKQNGGYAKGYNEALKNIDADIYALVNSDIEVTENWLDPFFDLFKNGKNIAAAQPKILDFKDKSKFEFAGAAGGYIDMFAYPFCRGRIFDHVETDNNQYQSSEEIFWASGACLFIRKNVFDNLQGFDQDYFAHMEEIDLCWRIFNSGYKIVYEANSTVYHVGGATLKESNPKKTYLNFRNSLYTIVKNAPTLAVFPLILSRLLLDGLAGVKFLFESGPKHTIAIVKAHFTFYANFVKMWNKRKVVKAKRGDYFQHWSVVFKYYLLGRKRFNEL